MPNAEIFVWFVVDIVPNLTVGATSHTVTAESGSNYNSMLSPQLPNNIWVTVSQTIQGSSTNSAGAYGCPNESYNWSYQSNMLQGPEFGNSWIQQVIEVSQTGNSCYTVEYWPNYHNPKPVVYSYALGISPSNILYEESGGVSFSMSYTGGPTYTVTAFYATACCATNGDPITWVIYPDQLSYESILLNSPVEFDQGSLEEFNIVGAVGGATATFTAGSGQINYCSYLNAGRISPQTGEQSNMLYSALTQNVCGSGNLNWFYQSFNPWHLALPQRHGTIS